MTQLRNSDLVESDLYRLLSSICRYNWVGDFECFIKDADTLGQLLFRDNQRWDN